MTVYGPYTPITRAGSLHFVSGQVGMDQTTKTAPTSIEAQTSQALMNLQNILQDAGLTLGDVVKTTVFLTDMENYLPMNDIYQGFFDAPRPARSTVAVKDLPHVAGNTKLLVEIEAIAVKGRV